MTSESSPASPESSGSSHKAPGPSTAPLHTSSFDAGGGHGHPVGWGAVIVALGVAFGDIGTSPLYALKECFLDHTAHPDRTLAVSEANVIGVLSLIIWSLIFVVTIKYLFTVLLADKQGEGGVLSLKSLAIEKISQPRTRQALTLLGVFGAALLYGDGMITPAISTLSAVEGLTTDSIKSFLPQIDKFVLPLTVLILIGLFSLQRFGTAKVGVVFGPVMILWFSVLAILGIRGIITEPRVLAAFNPVPGFQFLMKSGFPGFVVLGAVMLVVTGGESLYADLGHFGRKPIQRAWVFIVFPALLLNYLGQGAMVLHDHEVAKNPFFLSAPAWANLPLVILATVAAVIASQALISGAYSLTMQSIQLGFLPRMSIRHTSRQTRGQIYVPLVNWLLMLACIALVLSFGTSTKLAAAYGIAVTLTMVVTTLLLYYVMRYRWEWSMARALPLCLGFIIIEGAFLASNVLKIPVGGWFPLVAGAAIFALMVTWKRGRVLLGEELSKTTIPQELFIESLQYSKSLVRVSGTAVFLTGNGGRTPVAVLHNLKHNKVLHERVIFLTIVTEDVPFVSPGQQVQLEKLAEGFWRLTGHYGFMQEPDVPQLMRRARQHGLDAPAEKVTFFLGRETVVPDPQRPGMAPWREHIFAFLSRIAQPPANYFRLPENRVVELGMRVRI